MCEALDDTMLCLHHGTLVACIVPALDAQYNNTLTAQSYPGNPKCKAGRRRGITEGKYANTYWVCTSLP